MLYEVLIGYLPWDLSNPKYKNCSKEEIFNIIKSKQLTMPSDKKIGGDIIDLISRMLTFNEENRISIKDA